MQQSLVSATLRRSSVTSKSTLRVSLSTIPLVAQTNSLKKTPTGRLIFIRHGESIWNTFPVRFTGWADVPLTETGRSQARAASRCLDIFKIKPDAVYTSLLKRSKDSLTELIQASDTPSFYSTIPIINTWRLNERHYGALVGLSKEEAQESMGYEKVMEWRKSWDAKPPSVDPREMSDWKNALHSKPTTMIHEPGKQLVITTEKDVEVPKTESLSDCASRVLPVWKQGIEPRLMRGETVLIVAHANSIRAMIKHIDMDTMNNEQIRSISIPSAVPLVYDFHTDEGVLKPLGVATKLGMRGRFIASKELVGLNIQRAYNVADESKDSLGEFYDIIERGFHDIVDNDYSKFGYDSKDALLITDGMGIILHTNSAWDALCGFTLDEIKGKTCKFLQGPKTDPAHVQYLNELLMKGLPANTTITNYRKSGKTFTNSVTIVPVYDWLYNGEKGNAYTSASTSTTSSGSSVGVGNSVRVGYSVPLSAKDRDTLGPTHFIAKLDKTPDDI